MGFSKYRRFTYIHKHTYSFYCVFRKQAKTAGNTSNKKILQQLEENKKKEEEIAKKRMQDVQVSYIK